MPDMAVSASVADLAKEIKDGACILFLGAGVHCGPSDESAFSYRESERPPSGAGLSQRLAGRSDLASRRPAEDMANLARVSLDYQLTKSRTLLVREVLDAVQTGKKPSPLLRALAHLDFRIIVTTNYDHLFEDALREAGKTPFVSFYRNNVEAFERTDDYPYRHDPTAQLPFVLKIHGDVVHGGSSIVITEEDYIQFALRMSDKEPYHPIPRTAMYYLAKWPTLFLGYSLLDYNLRLLFKTLRWKLDPGSIPDMYSVDFRPDPLVLDVLQNERRQVRYIVEDVWKFVPDLYRAVRGEEMAV